MRKICFLVSSILLALLFIPQAKVDAQNRYVTIVNPVRGSDFWNVDGQELLDWYKFYQENIDLPATWLIRPDFLFTENLEQDKGDEVGLFLEVTPTWADKAGVKYNSGRLWSQATAVFLSGYSREERIKLISKAFEAFKERYNRYPKTVGAWHIDPFSAQIMKEDYGISSVLICADQYKTDSYQIWGGWWGVPYYPRESNLLMPANKLGNKLDLVIFQWAARDPINGYGSSVKESIYSVQVNDYLQYSLDEKYFQELSGFYLYPKEGNFGQLTVGIENDNSLKRYKQEFRNILKVLKRQSVQFLTAEEFSNWYRNQYKNLSPKHVIGGKDPLGSETQAFWEMTTAYRLGLIQPEGQPEQVRDFRNYELFWPDPYLWNRNLEEDLYWNVPAGVDSVKNTDVELLSYSKFKFNDQKKPSFKVSDFKWVLYLISLAIVIYNFSIAKWKPVLILLPASLVFSIPLVFSGRLYSFGLGFWGPNGHDAIWHLGLIQQLKRFKFVNPGFNGVKLVNYHWGSDLIMALTSKFLSLSVWDVYFRFFPLLLATLLGVLSYLWGKKVVNSGRAGIIFGLLNFFAGSLGWIYTLIREGTIGGESLFWSMQSISTLINIPFALSLVVLMLFVLVWKRKREKLSFNSVIPLGILIGSLVIIKIYAAVLLGLALLIIMLKSGAKGKKEFKFDLFLVLVGGLSSLIFMFLIGLIKGPSLLEYKPLWFTHSLIESLDKLYYPKIAVFRHNLVQLRWSFKKMALIPIEAGLILLFIIGNFGTRVLGIIHALLKFIKRGLTDADFVLISILFLSILFPLLFVQKGTTWNTIQFLYYGLFIANFYLAVYLNKLIKRQAKWQIILIVLLTIPTTYSSLKNYLSYPAHATIPYYEIQALENLEQQPRGTVLKYPFDKAKKSGVRSPIPLYLYETSLYISAYTGQVSFLADEMNLEITGYDWKERKKRVLEFFQTDDKIWARGFLLNNDIDYIYLVNDQKLAFQAEDLSLETIFDNGLVKIYQVRK